MDASRQVLRLTGSDRVSFLQGLVTNDLQKLGSENLLYAALLTPQGKYIADFFLFADGDAIYIDVARARAELMTKRFMLYRLRADIAIEPVDMKVARGLENAPRNGMRDPRHKMMGWRAYGGAAFDDNETPVDWDALEISLGVPASGIELHDDTYILEAGFERLQGVDFRKGCYVGQEVTARMKHKTNLRKGLARVSLSQQDEIGAELYADNRPVGRLFRNVDGAALASLRFDKASKDVSTLSGAFVDNITPVWSL